MDDVVADATYHKPDICLGSSSHKSQPVCDDTSGSGVVDEGPDEGPNEPPVSIDDCYEVTWTVDIAIAVPRGEEEVKRDRRGKRAEAVLEVPRARSYYHLEYNLLPEHTEPVKVDLAMFGPVVKIYKESESKTLRPWCEGDQMWVGWSQSFRVSVTRELLEELLSHRMHFRIWEGKDKVCSKARNDRPKAFKLPLAHSEDGGIRNMVSWLREVTDRDNSKMSKKKSNTTAEVQSEKTQEDGGSVKPQEQSKDTITLTNESDKNLAASHRSGLQTAKATAVDLENIKKNGIASVECSPLRLLAGATSLAERFSVACPPGVCEALCNISLDRALMSEQLKVELNPLVITIRSANSMPSTPVPFHVLREKCLPVYCQYQFHKSKMHKTKPQRHGTHVYFDDVLVVLAGSMGHGELREYLTGPPLEIQVHDRHRKLEKPPETPGLFGTRPDDDQQSSVAFVGRKRTAHDPVATETAQVYESYAVAHLDLSELMLGRRSLKVNLPIRSCPPPQLLGRERPMWERKMMDLPGVADGHGEKPVEPGHYFDSNAHLKVKVEIAHPLLGDSAVESDDCPLFGRIVFVFGSNNVSVLTKLRSEILKINTAAFNIGSCSPEILDRVLSDYPVSPEESESKDLDFVTGFHVRDEKMHVVVVEGLRHKAVKSLWETVPQNLGRISEEQVRVLYTSGLGFSKRIYGSLDVNLSPVHLHRPLEDIMRNPLVYVRDMLPHSCFQALSRLSQLCQARKLLEAVRCDLFPTEDMICSVSRELGTLPGKTEQKLQVEEEKEEVRDEPDVSSSSSPVVWERRHEPLDMHNAEYVKWKRLAAKQQLSGRTKDYVQENIREVQHTSMLVQKPKPAVLGPEPAVVGTVHNYSIQTFNSHRRGWELLRKEMAKEPDRRFTYSQQYQSATLEPGASTHAPRGVSFDCSTPRQHPLRPDQSRVEELKEPWRENILHANTLRPPLTRDRWPWSRHLLDFQLYTRPRPSFGPPPPGSTHLARELLQQEQLVAARGQYDRWPSKALPGGGSPPDDHSRLRDFKCYLGAGSGKFQEILKDEPRKYSLRKPGLVLKPLPALDVLNWVEDDAREAENKALGPGPFTEKNFSAINNAIPRRHSQYNKYRFVRFCVPHSLLHKRRSTPLTEWERARHALQSPHAETHPQNTTTARPFKNLVEVRTHRDVTLYAQ